LAESSFNGGDSITSYAFVRDDGPLTAYLDQETQAGSSYTFTGLSAGTYYRVKVAAINSIGQSEWSNSIGLYAVSKPD